MHEAGIVAAILERALALAEENGGLPIESIRIEAGALQQVVPEALDFAFNAAIAGTLAEGARLEWSVTPARVRCPACACEYEPDDVFWACPACQTPGGEAVAGDEIILSSVELRTAD